MKKVAAALITSSVLFVLHAEIPFNSTGQQSFDYNNSDWSWDLKEDVNHTKEVLDDGSTMFHYNCDIFKQFPDTLLYMGDEIDTVIYDGQRNLISENFYRSYRYSTRSVNNSYTYSADNRMLTSSKYWVYSSFRTFSRYSSNTTYFYDYDGPVTREISYIMKGNKYNVYYDTLTIDYEYDSEEKLIRKVTEHAYGAKETSTYLYTELPTGETVITENRSHLDPDGNWSWAYTHPIKTFCTPSDTIIEEYASSNGLLARRTYNSYTSSGTLLESTEYVRHTNIPDSQLERVKRRYFRYNEVTPNN